MTGNSYVVITPARNEAKYIRRTLASMLAQTDRPAQWVIVDDGSSDETAQIVAEAAAAHPWITLVRAPDRGERVVGAGVVEAFNAGLAVVEDQRSAFICKLDADLVLPDDYFARLVGYFERDPRLGVACGPVIEEVDGQRVALRHEPEMVFGAAKFFRRACFEEIGGLERAIGWDGIDCYQAMRRGWRTQTIADPRLEILHLRRMGTSHKTILHGCARRGRGLHYNRAHPLWVLASAGYRMLDRPFVVAGLCVRVGSRDAAASRAPRIADVEFERFLRRWQLRKMTGAVRALSVAATRRAASEPIATRRGTR